MQVPMGAGSIVGMGSVAPLQISLTQQAEANTHRLGGILDRTAAIRNVVIGTPPCAKTMDAGLDKSSESLAGKINEQTDIIGQLEDILQQLEHRLDISPQSRLLPLVRS